MQTNTRYTPCYIQWNLSFMPPEIGTTRELTTAALLRKSLTLRYNPIQYLEMDLRNKANSEFKTFFHSPLDVSSSQVSLYK